jgi:hypothetical protein
MECPGEYVRARGTVAPRRETGLQHFGRLACHISKLAVGAPHRLHESSAARGCGRMMFEPAQMRSRVRNWIQVGPRLVRLGYLFLAETSLSGGSRARIVRKYKHPLDAFERVDREWERAVRDLHHTGWRQ